MARWWLKKVSAFLGVAGPVGSAVPVRAVLGDAVVAPCGSHASAPLVLESGVGERQRSITEAAAEVLAVHHHPDSPLVFLPARRRIDADFPAIAVAQDRAAENCLVVLREFRLLFEAR